MTTASSPLRELEAKIADSHSEGALDQIQTFAEGLKDTAARLSLFNATGALVRSPILQSDTHRLGFTEADDDFEVLQGDIVSTEAAYFMGERVTGNPKYVVLNSSCDLVRGRRQCAALLRVKEVQEAEPGAQEKVSLLAKFKRRDSMYLPVLPTDGNGVLCNVIQFDGICQIRCSDLLLANRMASLSVVGWRIFGCFSRVVVARANPRECDMRRAVES